MLGLLCLHPEAKLDNLALACSAGTVAPRICLALQGCMQSEGVWLSCHCKDCQSYVWSELFKGLQLFVLLPFRRTREQARRQLVSQGLDVVQP